MRMIVLAIGFIMLPLAAAAEPASAILIASAAIAKAVAGSAAVIGALGSFGASLLGAAISIGGALLASLFQGQPAAAQSSLRTRQFETHPPFRIPIGEFPQEGNVVFQYVDGEFYYFTLLLSSIPIDGSDLVISMTDIELPLTGDIFDMELGGGAYTPDTRPYSHGGPGYTDRASGNPEIVTFWMGRGDQTKFPQDWIDYLADDLPDISTATWEGASVLHVRCRYGAESWARARWSSGAPPPVRVQCKWAKLYDPRLDATSGVTAAAGLHRWNDPDTWEYSSNPAIAWLNMALHEKVLAKPQETILAQMVADAADACDVVPSVSLTLQTVLDHDYSTDTPTIVNRTSAAIDPGHATLAYSRGTLEITGGELMAIGTDTDGVIGDDETCRWGVYFDLLSLGLDPSRVYKFNAVIDQTGAVAPLKRRQVITQASADANSTDAAQIDYSLPADAGNASVVFDTGFQDFGSYTEPAAKNVQGRYVGFTHYDGGASGPFILESDGDQGTSAAVNGSGGTRVITFSETLQENDIVIISISSKISIETNYTFSETYQKGSPDLPDGWTWQNVYWRRQGATPDTSVTITNNGGAAGVFLYVVIRGAVTSGVPWYETFPTNGDTAKNNTGDPDPPAATNVTVNDLRIIIGNHDGSIATPASLTGWTRDASGHSTGGASSQTAFIYTQIPTDVSSVNPGTINLGGNDGWGAHHLNIEPASGANGMATLSFTFEETIPEPKFRCDGLVVVESREWDLLKPIESCFAATRDSTGGLTGIRAGVYTAPTVTLSDPVNASLEYIGRTDPGVDKFIGVFLSRTQDYQESETQPYSIRTGDRVQTIELPFVREQWQAERVTKILSERAKRNRSVSGVWSGLEYYRRIGEEVTFNTSPLPMMDGDYRISSKRTAVEANEGGVRFRNVLSLIEDASAIYDYSHATDFPNSDFTVYKPPTVSTPPGDPQNLTAYSGNDGAIANDETASSASEYTAAILITFEASTGSVDSYDIQYKSLGSLYVEMTDIDADNTTDLGGVQGYARYINPITIGSTYTIRVRAVGPTGISDWVTTSIVAAAPSDPIGDFDWGDFSFNDFR